MPGGFKSLAVAEDGEFLVLCRYIEADVAPLLSDKVLDGDVTDDGPRFRIVEHT